MHYSIRGVVRNFNPWVPKNCPIRIWLYRFIVYSYGSLFSSQLVGSISYLLKIRGFRVPSIVFEHEYGVRTQWVKTYVLGSQVMYKMQINHLTWNCFMLDFFSCVFHKHKLIHASLQTETHISRYAIGLTVFIEF